MKRTEETALILVAHAATGLGLALIVLAWRLF